MYKVQMARRIYMYDYDIWSTNDKSASSQAFKVKDLMIIKQCNPSIAKKQELLPQEFLGAMTWLLYMIVILVPSSTENVSLPQIDIDASVKKWERIQKRSNLLMMSTNLDLHTLPSNVPLHIQLHINTICNLSWLLTWYCAASGTPWDDPTELPVVGRRFQTIKWTLKYLKEIISASKNLFYTWQLQNAADLPDISVLFFQSWC